MNKGIEGDGENSPSALRENKLRKQDIVQAEIYASVNQLSNCYVIAHLAWVTDLSGMWIKDQGSDK